MICEITTTVEVSPGSLLKLHSAMWKPETQRLRHYIEAGNILCSLGNLLKQKEFAYL